MARMPAWLCRLSWRLGSKCVRFGVFLQTTSHRPPVQMAIGRWFVRLGADHLWMVR